MIVSHVDASEIIRRAQPVIRATVDSFGRRMGNSVSSPNIWDLHDPQVTRFLARYGADRVTGMANKTTQMKLQLALVEGVEQGRSYDQIAESITYVFDVRIAQAKNIAATEVARASNFASHAAMKQASVEKKEWLATEDDATRESHSELDGTVIGIDEEFESEDGGTAMYPGDFGDPAEDANCRCSVLPVIESKRVLMSRIRLRRMMERERAPYDRRLRTAYVVGFRAQLRAVMKVYDQLAIAA